MFRKLTSVVLQVQENCIDLVGRIADRGAEYVPAREWMRICFELLEMLKAHKKGIRRATVNTFGYIAKAIGPQDVLVTLLNNLKVQERQNRVCTTVAIAIVAETCSPFTVLPALMNEYKVCTATTAVYMLQAMQQVSQRVCGCCNDVMPACADCQLHSTYSNLWASKTRLYPSADSLTYEHVFRCLSSMYRMVSSRHCPSCLSTLVKWARTTSMRFPPCWKTP